MFRRIHIIALLLALLPTAVLAQTWNLPAPHDYNDETVVYGRLFDTRSNAFVSGPGLSVAAFIDGECRGQTDATLGDDGSYLYVLRIYGDHNDDLGKDITFFVFDASNAFEYQAMPSRALSFTGNSEGFPSDAVILSFDHNTTVLQGFTVTVEPISAGETGRLVLTPVPADAHFNLSAIDIAFSSPVEGWTAAEASLESSDGSLVFTIDAFVPGQTGIAVTIGGTAFPLFDADGNALTSVNIGWTLPLHEGWQWATNVYGSVAEETFWDTYGGNALTELRTQDHLLYNDAEWGYFGTLVTEGMPQNTAYKAYMTADHTLRLWDGSYADGLQVLAYEGWTWLPVPFYYDRLLSNAFALGGDRFPIGMTLVSKDHGTAEWNGTAWEGDLLVLHSGESLLCYNPSSSDITLSYRSERRMAQGDEQAEEPEPSESPWRYNARRFSDNMTIVADMPDLLLPSDYSLGAFVGGECRGEGRFVDGHFFVTVHGRAGERIAFRLCHLPSGHQFSVDESVSGKIRLGSLRDPVLLHSRDQATGITAPAYDPSTPDPTDPAAQGATPVWYDLSGRPVADPANHRGILIFRSAKLIR